MLCRFSTWSLVEEIEDRLKREGREIDAASAGMEGEAEDDIPFSAKGRNGNAGEVAPSAPTEQNSAERTGNATESAGNDRPRFELETHTKNDLLKRSTIDDQDSGKAKAQAEAKNAADAQLDGFALTGSVALNLPTRTTPHKGKSPAILARSGLQLTSMAQVQSLKASQSSSVPGYTYLG